MFFYTTIVNEVFFALVFNRFDVFILQSNKSTSVERVDEKRLFAVYKEAGRTLKGKLVSYIHMRYTTVIVYICFHLFIFFSLFSSFSFFFYNQLYSNFS